MISHDTGINGQTEQIYELQHYETIILRVRDSKLEYLKPCSQSSIRAINQALSYIYSDKGILCKDLVKQFKGTDIIDNSSY